MQMLDKVTITSLDGGHPFHNLKQESLRNSPPNTVISTTLKSIMVTTISGRTVFKPIKK